MSQLRGEVFREGSVRDRLSHAVPVRLYSRPHRPYIRELARLLCLEALKAVPEGARGVFRAVPDPEAAAPVEEFKMPEGLKFHFT